VSEVYFYLQNFFMKLKNLIAIGLLAAPTAALAGTTLNGAGATFPALPAPLYQRWFQDYARTSGIIFFINN
jgi:ABC-type phosphate transport system substrate-binding protein